MLQSTEGGILSLLAKAKEQLLDLQAQYARAGDDWERARSLFEAARQIDSITLIVKREDRPVHAPANGRTRLPYYYVEDNRLVKVGASKSRDHATYTLRVKREDYDLIIERLYEMARQMQTFETRRLVDQCDVPGFEPLLVLNMLSDERLLRKVRRGHWAFVDAASFPAQVQRVWDRLQRQRQ